MKDVIARLRNLPWELEQCLLELAQAKSVQQQSVRSAEQIERRLLAEIAEQTDFASGKRLYPNEDARRSELTRRLAEDGEYAALRQAAADASARAGELDAHAEALKAELRGLLAIADVYASALRAGDQRALKEVEECF